MSDNFSPSNVISEDILISNDNFDKEMQEFIIKLKNKHIEYMQNTNNEFDKWSNFFSKNKNVYIFPERLSIKSPMTILNAPWGTGKTYFIEQIALNWNSDLFTESREHFKNFIVLDVWKFTSSSNILEDVIKQIYKIILLLITKNEKNKKEKKINDLFKKITKFFKFFAPTIFNSLITFTHLFLSNDIGSSVMLIENFLNTFFSDFNKYELENNYNKDKELNYKEVCNILNDINNNIDPTIVVLDNIERMGNHSWEIIKTIQQLSLFDKLLFLLPINKSQFMFWSDYEYEQKNESSIDKYITLGTYYNLRQDYSGLLKQMKFSDDVFYLIQKILNDEINGYKLSIRIVKNSFNNFNLIKSFSISKYNGLKILTKIWNSKIIIEEIENDIANLKNDFLSLKNELNKNRDSFNFFIIQIDDFIYYIRSTPKIKKYLSIIDIFENVKNEILNIIKIVDNCSFLNNLSFDFLNSFDKYNEILSNFQNELLNFVSELNIDINENKKNITNAINNNLNIKKEINKIELKINDINNRVNQSINVDDANKLSRLNEKNKDFNESYNKNESLIKKLEFENNLNNELTNKINTFIKGDIQINLEKHIFNTSDLIFNLKENINKITKDKNKNIIINEFKNFNNTNESINNFYYNHNNTIFDDKNKLTNVIAKLLS